MNWIFAFKNDYFIMIKILKKCPMCTHVRSTDTSKEHNIKLINSNIIKLFSHISNSLTTLTSTFLILFTTLLLRNDNILLYFV